GLPNVNSLGETSEKRLDRAPDQRSFDLDLLGVGDPEYKHLGLSTKNSDASKRELYVYGSRDNATRKLATFRVEESGVYFKWEEDLAAHYLKHADAIRSCVLLLKPHEPHPPDAKVYGFVLRTRVEDHNPFDLKSGTAGRPISWGSDGRPFQREL